VSEQLRSVLTVLFVATLIGVIVALATPQAGKQTKTFTGFGATGSKQPLFMKGFPLRICLARKRPLTAG
jgi:hypothetical protein